MQHAEIGIDNRGLAWREHVFSGRIHEAGDLSLLKWEPVFNRAAEKFFKIVPDKDLSWNWAGWDFAEKTLTYGEKSAPRSEIKHPAAPSVSLDNITDADTLEVTLYREKEQTASVKLHISDRALKSNIKFQKNNDAYIVSVNDKLPAEGLTVEKYDLERSIKIETGGQKVLQYYFTYRGTVQFEGRSRVFIRKPFSIYLAVVKQIDGRRRLIACTAIGDKNSERSILPMAEKEEADLRLKIENGPVPKASASVKTQTWDEWLSNWSEISQERFSKLVQATCERLDISKQDARLLTQNHPTAVLRGLVLDVLGCPYIRSRRWPIESLNGDDFLMSVGLLKKGLSEILDSMPTIEEKIWAIKEAENECLHQVIENVGFTSLPVLRRELHLVENRRDAVLVRDEKKKAVSPQ